MHLMRSQKYCQCFNCQFSNKEYSACPVLKISVELHSGPLILRAVVQKVALIILDGWGHGMHPARDAIYQANAPFVKSLYRRYPNSELITCGTSVGLPEGQMGNSEVGHLNIGAGRVVYQDLVRIDAAIRSGALADNEVLRNLFQYCTSQKKPLHLMGLVSDGGVHAHMGHLIALCRYAAAAGVKPIYLHLFTDGRDTDPKRALTYVQQTMEQTSSTGARIASLIGRYYAMDRDNRWNRTRLAYDLLVHGKGQVASDPLEAIQRSYDLGITDEFLQPIVVQNNKEAVATVGEGDALLCFNFRTDRCRQLIRALTQQNFPEHQMQRMPLYTVTMTCYDDTFSDVAYLFSDVVLTNTLGEVLATHGLRQLRIAETEKYPHVTYFFSGGREEPFPYESRILVPSPRVATYDLKPEMSAYEVSDRLLHDLPQLDPQFICLNYANADMVGHTGVFAAAIQAIEAVDRCVQKVVTALLEHHFVILLTADHGNSDMMINDDGSPNTAHTLNPVPLFLIGADRPVRLAPGKLADLAPTILRIMNVEVPSEMDGQPLLIPC